MLPHPIEKVWQYLTEPANLGWLAESELELKETGKVKFKSDGKNYTGEILTVQEPINLAYSWNDPNSEDTTYVWWKLMGQHGKTLLEIEHSGFRGLKGVLASYSYQAFWKKKLKYLETELSKA